MIGRTYFGGDQLTQVNLGLYNTIKWPYQPKHTPSCFEVVIMYHSQLQLADLNILVFCVCSGISRAGLRGGVKKSHI